MKKIVLIIIPLGIVAIFAVIISGLFLRQIKEGEGVSRKNFTPIMNNKIIQDQENSEIIANDDGSVKNFTAIINSKSIQARKSMGNRLSEDSLRLNVDIIKEHLGSNPQSLKDNPDLRQALLSMEMLADAEGVTGTDLDVELNRAGYIFFPRNQGIDDDVFIKCEYKQGFAIPSEKISWIYPEAYGPGPYNFHFDAYITNEAKSRNGYLAETYGSGIILNKKMMEKHFHSDVIPLLPKNVDYWRGYIESPNIFYEGIKQHEIVHIILDQSYNFKSCTDVGSLDKRIIDFQEKMPIESRAENAAEIHESIATTGDISFDERNAAFEIIKFINRRTYKKFDDQYNYVLNVIGESARECINGFGSFDEEIRNIAASNADNNRKKQKTDSLLKKLFLEIEKDELVCIQNSMKNISLLFLGEIAK